MSKVATVETDAGFVAPLDPFLQRATKASTGVSGVPSTDQATARVVPDVGCAEFWEFDPSPFRFELESPLFGSDAFAVDQLLSLSREFGDVRGREGFGEERRVRA